MLVSELINQENLDKAVKIQNSIFPRENAKSNFLESIKTSNLPVKTKDRNCYYLVKV